MWDWFDPDQLMLDAANFFEDAGFEPATLGESTGNTLRAVARSPITALETAAEVTADTVGTLGEGVGSATTAIAKPLTGLLIGLAVVAVVGGLAYMKVK